jgi:hypothetical protein
VKWCVALIPLVLLAGCCAAPSLDFVLVPCEVSISSEPPGAEVVQLLPLGQPPVQLGTTPLSGIMVTVVTDLKMGNLDALQAQDLLRHANTMVVRLEKPGYETFEGALRVDERRLVEHRVTLKPLPETGD